MAEQKTYVGSGRVVGQYGNIAVSICITDVPKDALSEYNGKTYLKVIVSQKREVDQYGKTHSVALDTWKPDPNYKKNEERAPQEHNQTPKQSEETIEYPAESADDLDPNSIPF